jgi:hypothetical protein
MMNWDAIGALGELVGAFAVLTTLVYLAVQIKHSRTLLDESRQIALSQVHHLRANSLKDILKMAMDEPLRGIVEKAGAMNLAPTELKVEAIDLLEQREKGLLGIWYTQLLIHLDDLGYQESLGLLDQNALVEKKMRREAAQNHLAMADKLQLHVPPKLRRHWQEDFAI